jgi:hypothetical protein
MDIMCLQAFQLQVLFQCECAVRARTDVTEALHRKNVREVFYALQNLLTATANISKALWGSGGKAANKRKQLRDSIGVADDSPLRTVSVRNHYEHFDERIERWWVESPSHSYLDMNVASRANLAKMGRFHPMDCFRNFDPKTDELTFWGEDFNIRELLQEIEKILPKLKIQLGES